MRCIDENKLLSLFFLKKKCKKNSKKNSKKIKSNLNIKVFCQQSAPLNANVVAARALADELSTLGLDRATLPTTMGGDAVGAANARKNKKKLFIIVFD